MQLASITAPAPGQTDLLLRQAVDHLQGRGLHILGALRQVNPASPPGQCDSTLHLLPTGPDIRITQDLGKGSAACRLDAGALETAVGLALSRLEQAPQVDLLVLNKFGLSEAEGRGFRALIAGAVARGIPVLLGLSDTHRAAFEQFAEGLNIALPADLAAVLGWYDGVVAALPADSCVKRAQV